uniref:Geranylgeranyl hydrogenase n=1 Tax=Solanum tuberosum TaxID=4113 RepID=M1A952_SOLTU
MAAQTYLQLHPLRCLPFPLKIQNPQNQTHHFKQKPRNPVVCKLRVAVIGGGPAGSSAAEALATGGIETFLFERSPATAKPCGGAIPLCMLDEFSIPLNLIDRRVIQMRIVSPSNLVVDFGKTLKPHEFIAMLRREVLDSFLRQRAESSGATLLKALVTNLVVPTSTREPYVIHYTMDNCQHQLAVDVIIGADGANSRVAKSIKAGNYTTAIAFQERIKLPEDKMGITKI